MAIIELDLFESTIVMTFSDEFLGTVSLNEPWDCVRTSQKSLVLLSKDKIIMSYFAVVIRMLSLLSFFKIIETLEFQSIH